LSVSHLTADIVTVKLLQNLVEIKSSIPSLLTDLGLTYTQAPPNLMLLPSQLQTHLRPFTDSFPTIQTPRSVIHQFSV